MANRGKKRQYRNLEIQFVDEDDVDSYSERIYKHCNKNQHNDTWTDAT